jgi:hypothetical protein
LRAELIAEAKFYILHAQIIIKRLDYQVMRIQLSRIWGDFYQVGKQYCEAGNHYQESLALSRILCSSARLSGFRFSMEDF